MQPSRDIDTLLRIMAALRTPGTGCPWDLEQNFSTIAPYTLEEAYEVVDAIERGDLDDLKDELGDLLLQVVFHAQMAEEQDAFAFGDVVEAITRKMVRRHPHIFGDGDADDAAGVKRRWEEIKAEEKVERATRRENGSGTPPSALDGVPVALPGLSRAVKLQAKAGRVGFDWNDPRAVIDKVREEIVEIEDEIAHTAPDGGRVEDEIGDLLFAVANLARHLKVDPDAALRRANAKFIDRFRSIEAALALKGKRPETSTLDEMEALWQAAKSPKA
jgi:ATP diphosphatase